MADSSICVATNISDCDEQTQSMQRICPSVVERYFSRGYQINLPKGLTAIEADLKSTNFNDVCILRHSNRLCIVTLAPSHPIIRLKDSLRVTGVSFKVTDKVDLAENKVSGKRKRGAHWLNGYSPLCIVTCSNGTKYTVYCGIRGNLIEINEMLPIKPNLLQEAYETSGYIAIVMPKLAEASLVVKGLLNEADYKNYTDSSIMSQENRDPNKIEPSPEAADSSNLQTQNIETNA